MGVVGLRAGGPGVRAGAQAGAGARHLRVVRSGERRSLYLVGQPARKTAGGKVETERRRLKAVADPAVAVRRAGQPPLRLTRRGRVVLQSVVIAAVVLTFAGVAATSKASPGVWATPGEQSVVVHTGDTLWSIASRHVPGGDRRAAVEAIRQLNGLRGTRIEVGQELVLPSR